MPGCCPAHDRCTPAQCHALPICVAPAHPFSAGDRPTGRWVSCLWRSWVWPPACKHIRPCKRPWSSGQGRQRGLAAGMRGARGSGAFPWAPLLSMQFFWRRKRKRRGLSSRLGKGRAVLDGAGGPWSRGQGRSLQMRENGRRSGPEICRAAPAPAQPGQPHKQVGPQQAVVGPSQQQLLLQRRRWRRRRHARTAHCASCHAQCRPQHHVAMCSAGTV